MDIIIVNIPWLMDDVLSVIGMEVTQTILRDLLINRFFHKAGVFKEIDLTKRQNDLINLAKANLEYL